MAKASTVIAELCGGPMGGKRIEVVFGLRVLRVACFPDYSDSAEPQLGERTFTTCTYLRRGRISNEVWAYLYNPE